MGPAVPGASGLFEALQLGLSHADKHHVWITSHLRAHLTDFEALARSIAHHPTHFAEIVPDYPSVIGSVDAAKPGMGGVLFAPGKPLPCGMPASLRTYNNALSPPPILQVT